LIGISEIVGSAGVDFIFGSAGDDTIDGGAGNDFLDGGEDSDTYLVGPNGGFDIFQDSGSVGTDMILATADGTAIGIESFEVSVGNFSPGLSGIETIDADSHTGVTIQAGGSSATWDFSQINLIGISEIVGSAGVDFIIGSAGDDTIDGGAGNDVLSGGAGSDTLIGHGGTTFKDTATHINGDTIVDFDKLGNVLDLTDMNPTTLVGTLTVNAAGTSGTLSLTDGTHSASLQLLSQFAAAGFSGSLAAAGFSVVSDGAGGTDITHQASFLSQPAH
jgi:Ca2+-binding RTX toxin-like protein